MNLFAFGIGYAAAHFLRGRFAPSSFAGTVTDREKADVLTRQGMTAFVFDGTRADPAIETAIATAQALLISIPPMGPHDLVLTHYGEALRHSKSLEQILYLSTVGVYGDRAGGWVDETTTPIPTLARSVARLDIERQWQQFGSAAGVGVDILRLASIYGPGKNALEALKGGRARRIVKPGQVFNRIHVEDIAATLGALMQARSPGSIWNVCDDEPAPPEDVITFAAGLIGVEPPPEIPFERAELSPRAASFYAECKRVHNRALKHDLGVRLSFPTYREGLRQLWEDGGARK